MQNRDFLLGAIDGVVDQIEFGLELFALFDLRAIGLQQHLRFGDLAAGGPVIGRARRFGRAVEVRGSHLLADRPQLRHDFAMHRHWRVVDDGCDNRRAAA
jgi:hypothetical protein